MNAHADPDPAALGPLVLGERLLRVRRGGDGFARPAERHEERVALSVDLLALVRLEGRSQQAVVRVTDVRVTAAQFSDEAGRTLDVRKQEGDGPARDVPT